MTDMRTIIASNKGFFNYAGLQTWEVTRLKEHSTCDKCKQAANLYVLVPALQMWVCEKCEKRVWQWGLVKLKHLLGYYEREKI